MRILIADDHRVFFLGISKLVHQQYPDSEIHEATNGQEIVTALETYKYDLILLDIRMPGVMSLEFVAGIVERFSKVRVLVLTMLEEHLFGIHFIRIGARGFIGKQATFDRLMDAIASVLSGSIYYGRSFSEQQIRLIFGNRPENPFNALSRREMDVLLLLLNGHTNKEISSTLSVSPVTVSTLRGRILGKLGTENLFAIKDLYELFGTV